MGSQRFGHDAVRTYDNPQEYTYLPENSMNRYKFIDFTGGMIRYMIYCYDRTRIRTADEENSRSLRAPCRSIVSEAAKGRIGASAHLRPSGSL